MPLSFTRSLRLTLTLTAIGVAATGVQAYANAQPSVTVESGTLAGLSTASADVFKGIPYAAPPVGALRWRAPQPPAAWSGARPAKAFGAACLQDTATFALLGVQIGPTSEDCLFLNVWVPKHAQHAPVMVWIYGGGHRYGAASEPLYDGTAFVRDGVILVSFNYRLAGLGYFAHPALTKEAGRRESLGNYGLMDEMAALRWVHRNIQAFGGDPRNVTVFGESSSALDVQDLMSIPATQDLFQKAIVESSCSWSRNPETEATLAMREADGVKLAAVAGLHGSDATAAELRTLPATDFLDPSFKFDFEPFIDGRLVRESSPQAFGRGNMRRIPLILGSNSDESSVYSPSQLLLILGRLPRYVSALYPSSGKGDTALRMIFTDTAGAACRWVAIQNARRAPTYLYRFSYVVESIRSRSAGAAHGSELPFVFDSWDRGEPAMLQALVGLKAAPSRADLAMTAHLHACWITFAKTGKPDCPGLPDWPRYSRSADELMDFGTASSVRAHFRAAQYDSIEKAIPPR